MHGAIRDFRTGVDREEGKEGWAFEAQVGMSGESHCYKYASHLPADCLVEETVLAVSLS